MGAIELTALLWREREALEVVLERQHELADALRGSDRRRIDAALAAREGALGRLRPVVLSRDIEIVALADEWVVLPGLTLATLPRYAPPGPWGEIFTDHLRALSDLATRAVERGREIDALLRSRGTAGMGEGLRLPVSPEDYTE
ncbi:flagellar biosynthesis protein FlgN [Planctomonas deserti]|uniref:flagellar biosynthesis protein FlgN n=1 Tax=Planctomonas deserti TaxID=2144185 RepID=UPI000D33221A|nr:flagellar biosynthesis protein FlgN [Planctomonas deserti]